MPDYIDITDQCVFNPPAGTAVTQTGNVVVSYTNNGTQLTNNIHYNVYPRTTFNQPYNISSQITNYENLFNGCSNFNQPVNIGSCYRFGNMFRDCEKLNQTITIPSSACLTFADNMFTNCCGPLNVIYENHGYSFIDDMFKRSGTKNRINMIFNNGTYSESTTEDILSTIAGSGIIFTKDVTNQCYYNTSENLYIYGLNVTASEWELKELTLVETPYTYMQTNYASAMYLDIGDILLNARFNNGTADRYLDLYYDSYGVSSSITHGTKIPAVSADSSTTNDLVFSYTNSGITKTVTKTLNIYGNNLWTTQPYKMSNNVTSAKGFSGRDHYNGSFQIGYNVTDCSSMFSFCDNFNRPIEFMPDSVVNCKSMFSACYNFNNYVNIGKYVTDCSQMFRDCYKFNYTIEIPKNVINGLGMFRGCNSLNDNIYISSTSKMTDCSTMFFGCNNFNKLMLPIGETGTNFFIPDNVINCSSMFSGCTKFNRNVIIGNKVENYCNMFRGCTNLSDHTITMSATDQDQMDNIKCHNMFNGISPSANINIVIGGTYPFNLQWMFYGRSSSSTGWINIIFKREAVVDQDSLNFILGDVSIRYTYDEPTDWNICSTYKIKWTQE